VRAYLVPSAAWLLCLGCATTLESRAEDSLDRRTRHPGHEELAEQWTAAPSRDDGTSAPRAGDIDGSLRSYVTYALKQSPALRATYHEWKASVHHIAQARHLPEPTITYGYFVRSVETRVGPQRHKLSVSQALPWPTKLTAGADARSLAAQSAERRYEGAALMLIRRVAQAYWAVWRIEREREVEQQQAVILKELSKSAGARIAVGQASLAEVAQIDLTVSRITDRLAGLDEAARRARSDLVAAIGAPAGTPTPVTDEAPPVVVPGESEKTLGDAAAAHPRVRALALMAKSKEESARGASAERYPDLMLGVDWIETGPAAAPGVADSGKDPVIVMLSVKVPVWGGIYGSEEDEARAESAAFEARREAAEDEARAAVAASMSDVRDAARQVDLYRATLVPQAQSVYGAVLGGYQTGRSSVASVLMAQRDLLELELGQYRARARHAIAWALLEEIVGRPVHPKETP
jgi:outer membrane protein TolC